MSETVRFGRLSRAFRDPMGKTLTVAVIGIVSLTTIGLAVVGGAIYGGTLSEGSTVGLIGTIVGAVTTCITAVSSRAQVPTQGLAQPPTESASKEPRWDS